MGGYLPTGCARSAARENRAVAQESRFPFFTLFGSCAVRTSFRYPARDLWARAADAWEEILSLQSIQDQQRTLVVAHNAINQALVWTALGCVLVLQCVCTWKKCFMACFDFSFVRCLIFYLRKLHELDLQALLVLSPRVVSTAVCKLWVTCLETRCSSR